MRAFGTLVIAVYFLVTGPQAEALPCPEVLGAVSTEKVDPGADHIASIREQLKVPRYKRLLANRKVRGHAKHLSFEIPQGERLAIDKHEVLALAVEALEVGNKKAYEIILEETRVTGSSGRWSDQSDLNLRQFLGHELVELFKHKPTLLYQWRYLKNLGSWVIGDTVLGNTRVWQAAMETPVGRWSFTISPISSPAAVDSSIRHYSLGRYERIRSIVIRALDKTESELGSPIPRRIYETRPNGGNEFGGTAIQLANFKGRTDRGENLLVFAANLKEALFSASQP